MYIMVAPSVWKSGLFEETISQTVCPGAQWVQSVMVENSEVKEKLSLSFIPCFS